MEKSDTFRRFVTRITYVNDDWQPSIGSCLRMVVDRDGNRNELVDFEPLGFAAGFILVCPMHHAVTAIYFKRVARFP
jgi:hypothetical protein